LFSTIPTVQPSRRLIKVAMAHLCGKSKLERETSTEENQCHAKRAKNVHQRV
jgi:hypothetical protein